MDDLISRAAALNAIDCWHIDFNSMDGAKTQTDCWRVIKELPAVDAMSVVHGRWQGVSPFVDTEECSNCRYNIQSEELETPYCPWCGAKMDGERRDDCAVNRR